VHFDRIVRLQRNNQAIARWRFSPFKNGVRYRAKINDYLGTPGAEAFSRLAQMAAMDSTALGRVVHAAMERRSHGSEGLRIGVEAVAREEVGKLQSGLAILEVIITIAPLIGLLGTLSGLIAVFGGLGASSALQGPDPQVIAAGISEALFTTVGGLVVAVPVVIAHSWLNRHIERLASRLEVLAAIVFAAIQSNGPSRPGVPAQSPVAPFTRP
jgi:biopolymer transport protein ExbB